MLNRGEIRIGKVQFNPDTLDLRDADGIRLKLRNKSSNVLACLARHAGEIVDKQQLMEEVWPDVTVSDESLTQCIAEIRRTIGDADQTLLATHIGKGYSLTVALAPAPSDRPLSRQSIFLVLGIIAVALAMFALFGLLDQNSPDEPPRIAVLRFESLTDDADQAYFAEGLAEDMVTDLSKIQGIRVLSPNSSFAVDPSLPTDEISRMLDVSHLLSGNVRRFGEELRISARLVDVEDDSPIWAERYDGRAADVFAFQDKISSAIVAALRVSLTETEEKALSSVGTRNPAAYDAYLRGLRAIALRRRLDANAVAAARDAFNEAIRLDPDYALAYAGLAWTEYISFETVNFDFGAGKAFNLAEKSLGLNKNALAHRTLAKRHFNLLLEVKGRRSPEDSLEHLEAARRLQPGDPDLLADLATTLPFAGRAEEAVQTIRRAMELNPTHPNWYFAASGVAFLFTNQPEQAVRDLQKWSKAYPDWHIPYVFLASAHGVAGQEEQARASIQKHDDLVGPFSLYALNRTWPMADPEKEIFNRGLMVAGVK